VTKHSFIWHAWGFRHAELRYLIRTMDEFSLYQGGKWRLGSIHSAARTDREQLMMVKVIR
jgi:hypothetical protein